MNPFTSQSERKIFTVSELTRDIKNLLEERYPLIWVTGELSNLRIPNSGHAYFSIKDQKAQIAAVMFRGQLRQLRFDLEDGMTLLAMGRISVYEPRGGYQIILEYAEPQGVGALQIAFEQLKRKLSDEGLFDAHIKRPLPFLPARLGVITSPTGAALQDIFNVIDRRFRSLTIDLYPVRVQGDKAAQDIVHAIELAQKRQVNDVLILCRGGGSLEDLAPFNNEAVARAMASSDIPIVSAVGHETDFTIADFVADFRAPTPSAAAEIVVPVKSELKARCRELKQRCLRAVVHRVSGWRLQADALARALAHPGKKIADIRLRLDHLVEGLLRNIMDLQSKRKSCLNATLAVLDRHNPCTDIREHRSALLFLQHRMQQSVEQNYNNLLERYKKANALLEVLNPRAILQRGYSITRLLPGGQVAMNAASIPPGQLLEIQLAEGRILASARKTDDRSEGEK